MARIHEKDFIDEITIEDNEQNLWKEENEAPIYFLYEMVQKALEINVVGFLNDWGYRRNEKKICMKSTFILIQLIKI